VALVTVAVPVAAWALEQVARRAEARDKTSPTSRRLRQGADFVQRFGRGPLAARLGGDRSRRHLRGTGSHSEPTSMAASRRPRPKPRMRVFGCCLPIPLGMGPLTAAGLVLLCRSVDRHRKT
jgi:hypothetical protein